MTPKVSVCITAYNHEPWIAKAIDSVLFQKVNFNFEILIGEDDSDDNTRNIVLNYARRYPDHIRLFLHNREDVLYVDGFATGRRNFINNIVNAKGEYIALLDGDDYWSDTSKLQRQVDILDAYHEHAICFHDVMVEEPNGKIVKDRITRKVDTVTSIFDLASDNYIHTPTCMYRRRNLTSIPQWLWETRIGDYPFHMLNALHGSIYRINRSMAVYRNTQKGVHSSLTKIGKNEAWLQTLEVLIGKFEGETRRRLMVSLISTVASLIHDSCQLGMTKNIESLLSVAMKHDPIVFANKFAQYEKMGGAFRRVCNHPVTGPLIALVRFLKRDLTFGRYED